MKPGDEKKRTSSRLEYSKTEECFTVGATIRKWQKKFLKSKRIPHLKIILSR